MTTAQPSPLAGRRIAVTGATGFLGRHIASCLAARGAQVVAVVRRPERGAALKAAGVELRRADLLEPEALTEALRGADALVSNAALFSLTNYRWDDYARTNVQGTENVLHAAARAAVTRVVHVSSVAVYRSSFSGLVDEDAPTWRAEDRRLPNRVYALSKALSEESAWRLAGELGLTLTTVRPSGIYGAGDPNISPWLERLARWPVTVVPALLEFPFVYAGDVAEGVVLALETPASIGRAYNLAPEGQTVWSLVKAFREARGHHPWLTLPFPLPLSRRFSSERARRELGWRPRDTRAGVAAMLADEISR